MSKAPSKTRSLTHDWGYGEENGPATWAEHWPTAAGKRQSPVNIHTARASYQCHLNHLPLTPSYSPQRPLRLVNNGHTVKALCPEESTLTGGPLGQKVYRLAQFHLHWGAEDDRGSEHTIDGRAASAEIHLVHWNSTDYGSIEEAFDHSNGLAALSVFVTVGDSHEGFDIISRHLHHVTYKDEKYDLDLSFNPACLLPDDIDEYWTYPGSLTTPPCQECVQFIVLNERVEFSPEQMASLRSLHTGDKNSAFLADNFRPVCELHDRVVQASFDD